MKHTPYYNPMLRAREPENQKIQILSPEPEKQAEQHQVPGMSVEAVYHLLMGPPSSICTLGTAYTLHPHP